MTSRAFAGRSEGPLAIKERELLNTRLADPKNWLGPLADPKLALQTHDDIRWTHPDCLFYAAIHGLNELRIFDNISMSQMRTNVKKWLETNPLEPAKMVAWHSEKYPRNHRAGSIPIESMAKMKLDWIKHCQGYAVKYSGDEYACLAIANLYNCNVNIHTSTYTTPINTHKEHTLNLALYKVESEIESEQWSHYCSTRPIGPREVAVREERTSDRMLAPFALVNPIALPNFAGTPGRQQALATSVGTAGGCPSRGGSAAVEAPSPAVATGAGPVDADPPPAMGEDESRMGGGFVTDVDTDGRLGQHSRAEVAATDTRTRDPGQGANLATVAGPREGAGRVTRRTSAAGGSVQPDAPLPPRHGTQARRQGPHAGKRAMAPEADNSLSPSAAGARTGTPGQGVNQAASVGPMTSAQDPIQHAPNASANNGGVPVAVGLGSGVAGAAVSGGPVGPDAAIHLRRYTQITQRQQPIRECWTATDKRDQIERLKQYYANPASLRGEQDPHRYLGQRVANTFDKDGHTILYEGTIIAYDEGNYGVAYDDGDFESNNADVITSLIEKWLVKTGQMHASARIQAGAPFALMLFHADSLERKAAMKGGFTFLTGKHTQGLSFELRDYNLPTSSNLSPELQNLDPKMAITKNR